LSEALVNPDIYPAQPGLPQEPSKDEDGSNYLRRLKGPEADGTLADQAAQSAGKMAAAMVTLGMRERRATPRIRCSGSVEFRVDGGDVRMWGTLTDISLHGCYVEMSHTHPVDTKVHLVFKSCGVRIQTSGRVRATYPALGMGILFTDIEPAEQLHLKELLAILTGHNTAANHGPAQESVQQDETLMKNALESADPRAALDGIRGFFQRNHLLSRDEFYAIAKRVRRA
jgi:PilZ domain